MPTTTKTVTYLNVIPLVFRTAFQRPLRSEAELRQSFLQRRWTGVWRILATQRLRQSNGRLELLVSSILRLDPFAKVPRNFGFDQPSVSALFGRCALIRNVRGLTFCDFRGLEVHLVVVGRVQPVRCRGDPSRRRFNCFLVVRNIVSGTIFCCCGEAGLRNCQGRRFITVAIELFIGWKLHYSCAGTYCLNYRYCLAEATVYGDSFRSSSASSLSRWRSCSFWMRGARWGLAITIWDSIADSWVPNRNSVESRSRLIFDGCLCCHQLQQTGLCRRRKLPVEILTTD